MAIKTKKWDVVNNKIPKNSDEVITALLENRGIDTKKEKEEFLFPDDPMKIPVESVGISSEEIVLAYKRIKKAKENDENVIVYGDYDADGISGTATMWEVLHAAGLNVLPHIPDRFSEGYGLNLDTVKKLKEKDPKLSLIVTVDHGIVAGKKVEEVKKLGIDMIISDHHEAAKEPPKPLALIYTKQIGGSAVAWFLARELSKKFGLEKTFDVSERLSLAAIGTIADQIPLMSINRSIVKFGIEKLRKTKRPGINAMFAEAKIKKEEIGTYEIGFLIAPRINSMGRLKHGLESLRLLCTKDSQKALQIAKNVSETNTQRQAIVDVVLKHAKNYYKDLEGKSVIVLADEKYHEGVIGLAAAKLAEEFYRPSIVLSKKDNVAKASARSIPGFNIIEAIRQLEDLYIEGGGHPMAAGFSIKVDKIDEFSQKLNNIAQKLLSAEILERKIKVDMVLDFSIINTDLYYQVADFGPFGSGNVEPVFVAKKVEVLEAKTVGAEARHLKLKLGQNGNIFDGIAFGWGGALAEIKDSKIDLAFNIDQNVWNGKSSLQIKVRDIKLGKNKN